ncbi:MAG: hypothetical protein R2715_14855 [Ilumatobacteraceae bacterium]
MAGLRANEARYFKNKYDHVFTVEPAAEGRGGRRVRAPDHRDGTGFTIASRPLEVSAFHVEQLRMAYVFYENGLSINVMYDPREPKKRAVGFKLSDGMDVPGGARIPLQVRPPEVQTGRHHPGLVLRHQGRVRVALIIDVHRCVALET